MEILKTKREIRAVVKKAKESKRRIGFVPTMGYLHKGHLALIQNSMEDGCFTVVSIFVNPLQFGPSEDFQRYPRDIERDISILEKAKVDAVFLPSDDEMYPAGHLTVVSVPNLSGKFEGAIRPGHFTGVCTIVAKLFNIVQPHRAYFGWKDAQQLVVIRRMVKDLDFDISVIGVQTVREPDGLAASSRNVYLSEDQRRRALVLSRALQEIRQMVEYNKIIDAEVLISRGREIIKSEQVELQYLEAVELENFEIIKNIRKNTGIIGAIKVDKVRLIDNIIWD